VYFATGKKKVLACGVLAVAFMYALLVPMVSAGRDWLNFQSDRGAGTRSSFVMDYLDGKDVAGGRPVNDIQMWWARLNYANAQAFAMQAYDRGSPGNSFSLALYAPIPRFIWPNKPVMTVGSDFNCLVTGSPGSQSAPGIFAEAYWNGGWFLVIGACMYVGVLFAWFTSMSMQYMALPDFRWLPVAFFGILMGVRPDDWFVNIYVSSLPVCVGYFFIVTRLIGTSASTRAPVPAAARPGNQASLTQAAHVAGTQ